MRKQTTKSNNCNCNSNFSNKSERFASKWAFRFFSAYNFFRNIVLDFKDDVLGWFDNM